MGSYALSFKNSVEKDLRKIPKELLAHIFEHIESLSKDPLPHDVQKLAGAESLYRIRVGEYRIIYQVLDESHEIFVYYIRHRSVAYRGL
ncbi:MAG: type II toxin-antitoxin system RelE/ParE family toxin [Methanoregula sp.]|jgi:mRNA interferase RelE/StbE